VGIILLGFFIACTQVQIAEIFCAAGELPFVFGWESI